MLHWATKIEMVFTSAANLGNNSWEEKGVEKFDPFSFCTCGGINLCSMSSIIYLVVGFVAIVFVIAFVAWCRSSEDDPRSVAIRECGDLWARIEKARDSKGGSIRALSEYEDILLRCRKYSIEASDFGAVSFKHIAEDALVAFRKHPGSTNFLRQIIEFEERHRALHKEIFS
jgi:hypothetical protein